MRTKRRKKLSSLILCSVLIVAVALFITGCNGGTDQGGASGQEELSGRGGGSNVQAEVTELGEGETSFDFIVTDQEGTETRFEIHTSEETVGAALQALGLIAGDESDFGLYVKTVNGITVDYDKDGVYWAFYVNGEYASAGVSSTSITEGDEYSFRVE